MIAQEWPLIVFTILAQAAVGAFVVLEVVRYFAVRRAGAAEADRLTDGVLLAIWPVMALALVASLFHLGSAVNAPKAINHLATSWLSREILSALLFAGVGVIFAFLQWRKLGSGALRNVLAVATALIGLFLVLAQSRSYMLPMQPAWNTPETIVLFYSASLMLGTLSVAAGLALNSSRIRRARPESAATQSGLLRDSLRGLALLGIIVLGVEMIAVPMQLARLAASPYAIASNAAGTAAGQYAVAFVLRIVLVFLGAGVLGALVLRNTAKEGREKLVSTLAYSALACVLASEVLGRVLFYAFHGRIGL